MNKYKLLLIFLLLFLFSNSKADEIKELEIGKRILKFENIKEGDIVEAIYELKNISNKVITIEYVNPDCICTKYTIDKKNNSQRR